MARDEVPRSTGGDFLADGFESNLPDDMSTGKASTEQMIRDFADYRKYIEGVPSKAKKSQNGESRGSSRSAVAA